MNSIKLDSSWLKHLSSEFDKPYFQEIKNFLQQQISTKTKFFPPANLIFNALDSANFQEVKVVIIGQDPYHSSEFQDGKEIPHAHGLSFSIPQQAKKVPPSLKNIYKEIYQDLGPENFQIPTHGNLQSWADQGVLLLNATLTVQAHQANSHSKIGWQTFTDQIITQLSQHRENLVFLLWGSFARSKKELIDTSKHLILESAHPSPFSAHKGFFGTKPFSQANQYLSQHSISPINWQV